MTKRDAEEIIQTTEGEIPAGNQSWIPPAEAAPPLESQPMKHGIFKQDS